MKTSHLKYIIEIDKTGSISKAAENLYLNQPQLSKILRELEENIGISIFKRSSKGVVPTTKGAEFIMEAKGIIAQLERLEKNYNPKKNEMVTLDIASFRSEYVCEAFSRFLTRIKDENKDKITYRETNTTRAIKNVATGENNIGIIRCNAAYEQYFTQMLEERDLSYEFLWEYDELILTSKNSPLAKYNVVEESDLKNMAEVLFGDNVIHYGRSARRVKEASKDDSLRQIFVYERAGMCAVIKNDENAYVRITPPPKGVYDENEFAIIPMRGESCHCRDILFFRKDYRRSETDKLFIKILKEVIEEL